MGNGKTLDVEVADSDARSRFKLDNPRLDRRPFKGTRSERGGKDRSAYGLHQHRQSQNVVRMFVGQKDAVKLGGILTDSLEAGEDFFPVQSRVDQDPGRSACDKYGIARAGGSEHANADYGGPPDPFIVIPGPLRIPTISRRMFETGNPTSARRCYRSLPGSDAGGVESR